MQKLFSRSLMVPTLLAVLIAFPTGRALAQSSSSGSSANGSVTGNDPQPTLSTIVLTILTIWG
jgi:hypothetical protein